MKKIIIIAALMSAIVSNSFAMSCKPCKCGYKKTADISDNIRTGMGIILGAGIPMAYMNYLMFNDRRQSLAYAMDGMMAAAIPAYFIEGGLNTFVSHYFSLILIVPLVASYVYPYISIAQAYHNKDSNAITRAWWGVAIPFIVYLPVFGLLACPPCSPDTDCPAFYPAIGNKYAGLNCSIRF